MCYQRGLSDIMLALHKDQSSQATSLYQVDQHMIISAVGIPVDPIERLNLAGALLFERLGHAADDPALLTSPQIRDLTLKKITTLLSTFPSYAQIRTVHLSRDSWTLKDGLVTSLLKLKRYEITKRFAREISDLYRGHDLPL